MRIFLAKRLIALIFTLLAATLVVFVVLEILPGDPASVMLGINAEADPAADTQCVQFEYFASEILVEPKGLVGTEAIRSPAERRTRTDRSLIVEIQDHRRVLFRRDQQVREIAEDVRTNCLDLVEPRDGRYRWFVCGYCKVVRPEVYEPLVEWLVRVGSYPITHLDLFEVVAANISAEFLDDVRCRLAVLSADILLHPADLLGLDDEISRGRQAAKLSRRPWSALHLVQQPGLWVAINGLEVARPGAEAETICGDYSFRFQHCLLASRTLAPL